MPFVMVP
jgi:regulator of protease activity HflC (stomatin/prohibitin superfamily)